jgi:hypothetical protein
LKTSHDISFPSFLFSILVASAALAQGLEEQEVSLIGWHPGAPLLKYMKTADKLVAVFFGSGTLHVVEGCQIPGAYQLKEGPPREPEAILIDSPETAALQAPVSEPGFYQDSPFWSVRQASVEWAWRVAAERAHGDCKGVTHILTGLRGGWHSQIVHPPPQADQGAEMGNWQQMDNKLYDSPKQRALREAQGSRKSHVALAARLVRFSSEPDAPTRLPKARTVTFLSPPGEKWALRNAGGAGCELPCTRLLTDHSRAYLQSIGTNPQWVHIGSDLSRSGPDALSASIRYEKDRWYPWKGVLAISGGLALGATIFAIWQDPNPRSVGGSGSVPTELKKTGQEFLGKLVISGLFGALAGGGTVYGVTALIRGRQPVPSLSIKSSSPDEVGTAVPN